MNREHNLGPPFLTLASVPCELMWTNPGVAILNPILEMLSWTCYRSLASTMKLVLGFRSSRFAVVSVTFSFTRPSHPFCHCRVPGVIFRGYGRRVCTENLRR